MSVARVLHATAGRVRLRLPLLWDRTVRPAWLEAWLETLPGVREVRVNRKAACVVVEYDRKRLTCAQVLERVAAFDAGAAPLAGARERAVGELAPMLASAVTVALLPWLNRRAQRWLTLVNVSPLLLAGVRSLFTRGIRVEVLDALAVGLSAWRGQVYTANVTAFLLALGEYLERQTQRSSDRLLRRLLHPAPATAWVERDGQLVQVAADGVRVGEIVQVGTGETIPVDGRVVEGVALVNQSAVTGEDLPVRREAPQRVVAGSTVEEGRLRIEAQRVGADTTPSRVASFIQAALEGRADTQRLAEELADRRVWLTLITGALVYALTRDLTRMESVFLVDYSCALKLGTPIAFKSGMARAARHGILMRGGAAIERLAAVDTVVFDKTGTLTHSELAVTDVVVLGRRGLSPDALLALVASLEEHATHPMAQAVVEAAREKALRHISHGEVSYLIAHGLTAEVQGRRVIIGSRHFLEEHHGIRFDRHAAVIEPLLDAGKGLLYVGTFARGRPQPLGLIALRDTPRADAAYTLRRLRALGIERCVMITGDKRQRAQALAAQLGIDELHAEVAPEDKAAIIRALQTAGRKVLFIGDGVNDGPALSVADVGIAMPRGADIARATADIVLMDDRLAAVAEAREIAQRTMRLIRSNFNLAVGVNTAILTGAVLGWLPPVVSALAHNGTTLAVLARALTGTGLPAGVEAGRRPVIDIATQNDSQ